MRSCFAFVVSSFALAACAASSGDGGDVGEGDDAITATCAPTPACDGRVGPTLGAPRGFTHAGSSIAAAIGNPTHRGRDQIFTVGEPQWIIAKLAYGALDKDLEDEEVEVWVERGCAGAWEKIGTTRSGKDGGTRPAAEGIEDTGGRVLYSIPADKALPPGRHRVRLVVAGDHSSTDLLVDVVAKNAKIVVSDVDGTLTSGELAEFPAGLVGVQPGAQPHAAEVLSALAAKGYRVVYLTARAERLTARTHEFLAQRGFPNGIVHTTTSALGYFGDSAARYKSDELKRLVGHQLVIGWAFGNRSSDTDAYDAARVMPVDHRVFLGVDDAHGGRKIGNYADVLPAVTASTRACKQ